MQLRKKLHAGWLLIYFLIGCAAAPGTRTISPTVDRSDAVAEDSRDAVSALKSVAQSLSGKELSDAEMRDLAREVEKNPETRQAVEAVVEAIEGRRDSIKYCPVCGKRYGPNVAVCPEHGVTLKMVGE